MTTEKITEYRKALADTHKLNLVIDPVTKIGRMTGPQPWADMYNDLARYQGGL